MGPPSGTAVPMGATVYFNPFVPPFQEKSCMVEGVPKKDKVKKFEIPVYFTTGWNDINLNMTVWINKSKKLKEINPFFRRYGFQFNRI
jgi:hypothetical protein